MDIEIATLFGLALLNVSLWTFRVAVAARGLKLVSSGMAAVEAVMFACTFSRLVSDLGSPGRILGYAAGVGTGTAVGLLLNDRTARGHTELHLVALGDRADLIERFRERGWPATSSVASGPEGPVTMMWLTVSDAEVRDMSDLVRQWAPQAFWTLRRLHKVTHSPSGFAATQKGTEAGRGRGPRWRPDLALPTWRDRRHHRVTRPESSPALG